MNLGQGFPDFEGPQALRDAFCRSHEFRQEPICADDRRARLREQIALKTERLYGRHVNPDTEVTVTSGATEALFAAIAAVVRPGDEVIVLDPCYDS